MTDYSPLDESEQRVIHEAQRILGNTSTIPCTACRYCTEGCPQQIAIPEVFAAANLSLGSGRMTEARAAYEAIPAANRADACIGC